jgi:hypothetical protein
MASEAQWRELYRNQEIRMQNAKCSMQNEK